MKILAKLCCPSESKNKSPWGLQQLAFGKAKQSLKEKKILTDCSPMDRVFAD